MKHLFVKTTTKSKEETDTRSRGELLQTSRDHPWWTGSGPGSDDFWWHVTYSLLLCSRKCSVVCEDPEVQSTVGGFFKSQTHRQRWMFLGVLWRLDPGAGSPASAWSPFQGPVSSAATADGGSHIPFQVSSWEHLNYEIDLCVAES